MRLFKDINIDFIAKKGYAKYLSIILIVVGLGSLITKGGPTLSIDFTGGTIAQLQFPNNVDVSHLRNLLGENEFINSEIIIFGNPNEVLIKTQFSGSNSLFESNLRDAINSEFEIRRIESVGPKIVLTGRLNIFSGFLEATSSISVPPSGLAMIFID